MLGLDIEGNAEQRLHIDSRDSSTDSDDELDPFPRMTTQAFAFPKQEQTAGNRHKSSTTEVKAPN
jgi:hypothetical protein